VFKYEKGRIACAKIADKNLDAQLFQLVDGVFYILFILHKRVPGDFDLKQAPVNWVST
jgi:hypothetical protein